VLGSVVRDPYHIGFNAVLALSEIKKSGNTSAFVDTGISVLDRSNVSEADYGMGP
jgi:ribose transport system substrate-binding protein